MCSILQQRSTVFDGVGDELRPEGERAAQGHAKQQPASTMRMRGREGGAKRVRQEMMARQPAGATKHREAARRDDETTRDVFFQNFLHDYYSAHLNLQLLCFRFIC